MSNEEFRVQVFKVGDDQPIDEYREVGIKQAKARYRKAMQSAVRMGMYVRIVNSKGEVV